MIHDIRNIVFQVATLFRNAYGRVVEGIAPIIHLLYWPSLVAGLFFCVYWQFHLPTAGIAIGALGAVGVLVAIKGEKLQEGHKVIWAIITLVFLVTEVRAIKEDRKEQNDKQAETIKTIVQGYENEMIQNQNNFRTTMQQFATTTSSLQGLAGANAATQTEQKRQFGKMLSKQEGLFARQLELAEFLNGKLLPASDPTPPYKCASMNRELHEGEVAVFVGSTVEAIASNFPHTILLIHKERVIFLERSETGSLVLSVEMRDSLNRVIMRINRNGFVLSSL